MASHWSVWARWAAACSSAQQLQQKVLSRLSLSLRVCLKKSSLCQSKGSRTQARSGCLRKTNRPGRFCPPIALEFNLPVYPVDDGATFIVDDRALDYAELAELEAMLKGAEQQLGLTGALESGLPMPGDSEGQGSEGDGGAEPTGWGYQSNVLWLELVRVTNQIGAFIVHSPDTNGVYDLFATTNLSPDVPGFNLTNWFWVLRTLPRPDKPDCDKSDCYRVLFQAG